MNAGRPHSGSEVWEVPNRETAKSRENRGQIVAHGDFQSTTLSKTERIAATLDPACGQPILPTESHGTHRILRQIGT